MPGLSRRKRFALGIHDVAPVQVAPIQTQHQHLGGGQIAGKGDVVLVAQPGDVGHILIGGLLVGVAEAQHHVDLVVSDAGRDLLAAAVGKGEEPVDGQTGGLGDLLAGAGGGAEGVLGQYAAVGGAELHHQLFLVVMRHQSDIHKGRSFLRYIFIRGTLRPMMRLAMFS